MKRWIGVGTPISSPMRTTAPLNHGSSSRRPRSRSSSIDDRVCGGSAADAQHIATEFGITVPALIAANPGVSFNPLAQGTAVLIPLRVDPAQHTRFLVVWLTKLPPVTGGFRGEIAEVTVRS